jgi:predicted aspartyl protease
VGGHPFGKFPTVFVRIRGRNSIVREFNALLDPGVEYCIIPKVDAYALGYPEAANDDPISPANNTLTFTSYNGYGKAALIEMGHVELGTLSFEKVDFLAMDIPPVTGFDVVLGRSLLQFMKVELDYSVGQLRIEDVRKRVEA